MSDIRKRTGAKGTTYQVRYPSSATKSGYAYKTFSTQKEARAFLEGGNTKLSCQNRESGVTSVGDAIDFWLDVCEKEGRDEREPVSPATLENYRWRARTMKKFNWDKQLCEVEEPDVIAFRSWLKRNCTPDQGQKVMSSFHSVLIEMKRRGYISADPAENVTLRTSARHKEPVSIPTLEDMQEILRAADRLANSKNNEIAAAWERYRPMIYLAADSGMRPQEYLVLPVAAIDERGVRVVQALDRSNRIGPPKTKAGRRYIPVGDATLDMVRHYASKHDNCGGFAFPTRREGDFQRYNVYVRRGFHKLMDEAGMVSERRDGKSVKLIRRYRPYSLRHFFASMLIEQKKSLKFIQSVMGHENIKMTFDVYGHIIRRKEIDEIDEEGGILRYLSDESCGKSVAKNT
ncbi:Transposase from transposon Tn916 [Defluviimonas aquaemixtae]|uniref:Transposase from transposon Tn916 n=1 Tax=Albidovulum aquaemixtae TaxID=1542388 RepID=A0A2R8B5M3_9RHOB|nr:site-specific integrase [Defluviimonas aquaemixtae]SPH17929.1 Transposase from transposon Tn916 [Defluviimonas aquaemixtae]